MDTRTQDVAGYYVWEVPGHSVAVQLRLEVVDRLATEVLRGFGSVPKRGAEVGGLLIGNIRPGSPTVVRIDNFEPVACEYRRGPSYLFTDDDGVAFEDCWERFQPGSSPSAHAVGYFRSNTREEFALAPEDIEIMEHFFPDAAAVALLIRPYATKASVGGFFVREHGGFPETTPLEFPLSRRELMGEEPAPRRPLMEPRMTGRAEGRKERRARALPAATEETPQAELPFEIPARRLAPPRLPLPELAEAQAAAPAASGKGWIWLAVSFLFLLLGLAAGFEFAVTRGARAAAGAVEDFSLSLTAKKSGDNLGITWNRLSPVIRSAQKGVLEIDDGGYTKPVLLDPEQLQNGSLIYHNGSNSVRLRLTVYPQARVSVVETLEWKR